MREFKVTDKITPRKDGALAKYFNDVEKYELMDIQTEIEVAKRAFEGDKAAQEKLVKANLRFVLSVAKMYTKDPDTFQELVAAGNIGLIEASEKFDYTRGFKFISYAVWHIRKEMINYLSSCSRTIKIPQNKINELRAVVDAAGKLEMTLGRDATNEEALEYLKETNDPRIKTLNSDNIKDVSIADLRVSSLDSPLNDGSDSNTLIDIIKNDGDMPDSQYEREHASQVIQRLFRKLTTFERTVVMQRHSLFVEPSESMETPFATIAKIHGVSMETVRKAYLRALKKMKKTGVSLNIEEARANKKENLNKYKWD